ncbi:hypothetical protein [Thalassomonas actiniarum]|uniref:Uncharacterized protein n=1 Tax=Thalassomonas actiniarum TaxID=485447 RepID=A0AAE9YT56_9GAMM|nr:hypothetical protein [Thalassomonas actiniarum]WDD99824.1 hypothetical protein SG35_003895 [Thalassomonas actiniarum]
MSNKVKTLKNKKDDNVVGLLPPMKLMGRFLLVTMLLTLGSAASSIIVFDQYLNVSPELMFALLSVISVLFCVVNFRVSRGSFFCAKILQYYTLLLATVCLPAFVLVDNPDYIFYFINIFMMLFTFHLITGKAYGEFVKYQYEHFADIKEAREEIEKIINGKEPKKR